MRVIQSQSFLLVLKIKNLKKDQRKMYMGL